MLRHRRQAGLAGSAIDAGMVVSVGLVAQNAALQRTMERLGFDPGNNLGIGSPCNSVVVEEGPPFTKGRLCLIWSVRPVCYNVVVLSMGCWAFSAEEQNSRSIEAKCFPKYLYCGSNHPEDLV